MHYEELKNLSLEDFRRLTGVKKEVFELMHSCIVLHKTQVRKHPSRGRPSKLSLADQLLVLLMYYREYRTYFHIGQSYGLSESRTCEVIQELEEILIKNSCFHIEGKKGLLKEESALTSVVVDVTEHTIERPKKNKSTTIQVKKRSIP